MGVIALPRINRDTIAQTGFLPDGLQLFQDSMPLQVLDMKKVLSEDTTGKKVPVMKLTGVFQRSDEKNANGRIYPKDCLEEAVSALVDPIKNRRVMGEFDHPCLILNSMINAKVLTISGWKPYDQVKVGDYVYSRVNGQMVPSMVNAVIDENYEGKAYNFKGRHIDICFTAPHKMILDTRDDGGHVSKQIEVTANELYENRSDYNKCRIPRTANWIGEDKEVIVIPGVPISKHSHPNDPNYDKYMSETDDIQISTKIFASFLGIYLAEGHINKNEVEICQIKDDYKPQIRELLSKLIPEKKWIEDDRGFHFFDRRLAAYLKPLGDKYTKYIPEDIKQLDGKYLEELVYWFQLGDGRQKYDRSNIFSVSERLINDLHECWVKAGHCCYRTTITTDDDYEFAGRIIKAENKKPLHQLTLSHTTGIYCDDRFLDIESVNVKDRIWCLTTEHGNFYVENNGCSFWTGNCDAKIHMERVSHLITKLWMDGGTVIGEMEVINDDRCPCGSMLACYIDRGIQVGISSRGVGDMEVCMHEGEDAYKVQPGFQFVTFDAVAEPSVKGTQLKKLNESFNRSQGRGRQQVLMREHLLVKEVKRFFSI